MIIEILKIILLVILALFLLGIVFRRRLDSSDNKWVRLIGVNCKWDILLIAVLFVAIILNVFYVNSERVPANPVNGEKYIIVVLIALVAFMIIKISNVTIKATKYDNRFKRDSIVVCFQTITLITVFIAVAAALAVLGLNSKNIPALAICVSIITYVFQDTVKNIVAFYYLRKMGIIHIGDWVIISSRNVNGEICDVSLLSVSIRNWDSTITTLPTAILQSDVVQNMHEMEVGKTSGRIMDKTFYIDNHTIKTMNADDINELKQKLASAGEDTLFLEDVEKTALNLNLFRKYVRHWLCVSGNVTQYPYMIVSLADPTSCGLPFHIYVFLVETSLVHFEEAQCEIMEHIIESMNLFGLRQFQCDTKYDAID